MILIMDKFRVLAKAMHALSGVLLVIMMATVLLDVISRAVFDVSGSAINFTFYGGIEIVSHALLFAVLFSLPYSVLSGQVIVDLFTEKMNASLKRLLSGLYTFGFCLLGAGMAWRLFEAVVRVHESGEVTQDLLIPLSYIYGLAFFAALMLAVRGFLVGIEEIFYEGEAS